MNEALDLSKVEAGRVDVRRAVVRRANLHEGRSDATGGAGDAAVLAASVA